MVTIRALATRELERVPKEIDISERGSSVYRQRGDRVREIHRSHERPRFDADDWQPLIEEWTVLVKNGAQAYGAFDGPSLVGIAVLRPRLTPDMAQLAALYVDARWRRRGVAGRLVDVVEAAARRDGHRWLYVSATPSDSAVGFYLARGFAPVPDPHPALLEREPDDIHMKIGLSP